MLPAHEERLRLRRQRALAAYHNNKNRYQNAYLRRTQGITLDDYHTILDRQGGACAICRRPERARSRSSMLPRRLAVDHCHKTNRVRGLLCHACNTSLGHFEDNPDYLRSALAYLLAHT